PKITSSMRSPRRLLALCSPSTHVSASTTLLLPHPFGPTIAVTPASKCNSARSGKLLKPAISRRLNRIGQFLDSPRKHDSRFAASRIHPDPEAAGRASIRFRAEKLQDAVTRPNGRPTSRPKQDGPLGSGQRSPV